MYGHKQDLKSTNLAFKCQELSLPCHNQGKGGNSFATGRANNQPSSDHAGNHGAIVGFNQEQDQEATGNSIGCLLRGGLGGGGALRLLLLYGI